MQKLVALIGFVMLWAFPMLAMFLIIVVLAIELIRSALFDD